MVVVNCFTRKASGICHLSGMYLCRLNHCSICLLKKGHTVLVILFLLERGADTVDRCQHARDSLGSPLQGFVEAFKLSYHSRSECKTQDCFALSKMFCWAAGTGCRFGCTTSHFIQAAENSGCLAGCLLLRCLQTWPWISLTDQSAHRAGGPKKVSPGSVGRLSKQSV